MSIGGHQWASLNQVVQIGRLSKGGIVPIRVYVLKRKGWFPWDRKLVIDDSNNRIEKMPLRVSGRGFPTLNKIGNNKSVKFEQNDFPILLDELRNYREKLDSDELEVPNYPEEYWNFVEEFDDVYEEGIKETLLIHYKITNEERETISRLIEIVDENIGKPNTSILFRKIN